MTHRSASPEPPASPGTFPGTTATPTARRTAFTRRQVLLGSAAVFGGAALASSLAGCSTAAVGSPGSVAQLKFWHLLSGGDGVNMSDLVAKANKANPELHATATVLAWGTPYYTKLAMASAGGRAPDLAVMHASRIPGYAPGGLLDTWDVDKLAKYGITEKDFSKAVWDKVHSDGKLYAVALDSHPFIMLYNTKIAKKAGVLGPDGRLQEITSPEQFLEVGKKLQKVTGKHGMSYGYLGDGAQMWRMFYTFYRQMNGEMSLPLGGTVKYDEDKAVKALEFMQKILDGTVAAKSGDGGTAIAEFVSQESGILFTGVWEVPTAKAAGIPFDGQTIPTIYDSPAVYCDSHTFVLPRQNNVDPVKREDTYKFVATILKDSIGWAEGGHIPAYLPVVESPAYAKLLPQAHYADASKYLNYDPVAWFTGSGSDFQTQFANYIQGCLLNGTDARKAMRGFIAQVNSVLAKPAPV
jgi:multiple sugar transport system substrate-binding protein